MTERQEKLENYLLECQKEIDEKPDIVRRCQFIKMLVKKYIADSFDGENFQGKSREILTEAIIEMKYDILTRNNRWVCGTSDRSWRRRAEWLPRALFRENENDLEELIMSCTKDEELSARQQAIIQLFWKQIGWPISHHRNMKHLNQTDDDADDTE